MVDPKSWESKRLSIMKSLITLKFTQNVELKAQLLKTVDYKLGEAGHNAYFAIGMSLTNKGVCVSTKWKGNKLGEILMEVRTTLSL